MFQLPGGFRGDALGPNNLQRQEGRSAPMVISWLCPGIPSRSVSVPVCVFWGQVSLRGRQGWDGDALSPEIASPSQAAVEVRAARRPPKLGPGWAVPGAGSRRQAEEEKAGIFLNERLAPHPAPPPGSRLPPATRRCLLEAQPVSIATALSRGSSE